MTSPASGTLNLNANGSFTYTPVAGATGTQTFTYKVSDGYNFSQNATATISVVNSTPTPTADLVFTPSGQDLPISLATLLQNDVDTDGDATTFAIVSGTTHGTLTTQPDGSLLYHPNAGFSGTDTFQYTLSDGLSTSNPVAVRIRVNNAAPLGIADFYSVRHDHVLNVTTNSVVANDIDDDGDTLTVTLASAPATGTLVLNPDGTFVYTPTAGMTGDATFTYRVTDGIVTSDPITATIHVTNAAAIGRSDSYAVHQGHALTVDVANGVLANDTDADSDTLTPSLQTGPAHGTLSLAANGSFTYTPNAGYTGSDSFSYNLTDGLVTTGPITANLTVSNVAPNATSDSYHVLHDQTLIVPALTGLTQNDFDIDGDSLATSVMTTTTHGTLTMQSDGSFSYAPSAAYVGRDTFTYRVFDGASFSGRRRSQSM
ncbi:MAG: Ig-like domain-containing protein [Planctomycetaceae bacterium]